jgi:UDP-N-acetyl-D-galactosamine dehydrogenase
MQTYSLNVSQVGLRLRLESGRNLRVLAGRRINDNMGVYIAQSVVKLLTQRRIHVVGAKILILGLTFKENCPDIRNTKVVDLIEEFSSYHATVDVYDPWINPEEAKLEYDIRPVETLPQGYYDAIIIAVGHDQFRTMGSENIRRLGKPSHVLFDVKYMFPAAQVDARL